VVSCVKCLLLAVDCAPNDLGYGRNCRPGTVPNFAVAGACCVRVFGTGDDILGVL